MLAFELAVTTLVELTSARFTRAEDPNTLFGFPSTVPKTKCKMTVCQLSDFMHVQLGPKVISKTSTV